MKKVRILLWDRAYTRLRRKPRITRPHSCMTKRFHYTPVAESPSNPFKESKNKEKTEKKRVRKLHLPSSLPFPFLPCSPSHKKHDLGRKRSWGQGHMHVDLLPPQIHPTLRPSIHTHLAFLHPLSCTRRISPQFSSSPAGAVDCTENSLGTDEDAHRAGP